jgi:hypothetical protein
MSIVISNKLIESLEKLYNSANQLYIPPSREEELAVVDKSALKEVMEASKLVRTPIAVIVTKNDNLEEVILCDNPNSAELVFLNKCSQYISNWTDHTADEVEDILDDGHYGNGAGVQIFIFHPEIHKDV